MIIAAFSCRPHRSWRFWDGVAAKSVLVRVKDEKREAEEETEDAHGLSSDLARTVDALQTKIDELAELAKASGADPCAIKNIKGRKNV